MIKLCRTWLIFLFLNFSKVALNEIYFPIMSIKIPTISFRHMASLLLLLNANKMLTPFWILPHLCFASFMQLQHLDFTNLRKRHPSTFCKSLIRISTKDVILPKS